jgi:hypothetical protein
VTAATTLAAAKLTSNVARSGEQPESLAGTRSYVGLAAGPTLPLVVSNARPTFTTPPDRVTRLPPGSTGHVALPLTASGSGGSVSGVQNATLTVCTVLLARRLNGGWPE